MGSWACRDEKLAVGELVSEILTMSCVDSRRAEKREVESATH